MKLDQLLRADVQMLSAEDFVRRELAIRELRLGRRTRAELIACEEADDEADVAFALFMCRAPRQHPAFDAEWDRLEVTALSS